MTHKLDGILADYYQQIDALLSFITDPTGDRAFQDKSRATRDSEHGERLARTVDFLDFAGNPQQKYESIHVAGTSGKGSVSAMLSAILTTSGLRTGLHISPYLQICNEKLIVDGQMVSPQGFAQSVRRFLEIHVDWMQADRAFNDLRYGEAWVSLTYLWFAWQEVQWLVMEAGLGGRYDPTNAIDPELSVITNVNFDHLKSLGPGLLDIAHHKAGIIKPGRPVITAEQDPSVVSLFQREADKNGSRLYVLKRDFDLTTENDDRHGAVITVYGPDQTYRDIHIPVPGTFQVTNAALAVAGLDILASTSKIALSEDAVRKAMADFKFIGRMEIVQERPLTILDGAHNPHKIKSLVASLEAAYPAKRITAIMGMMRVKNAQTVIETLAPIVSRFIFTAPLVYGKRSFPPDELADIAAQVAPELETHIVERVQDSVEYALRIVDPGDLLLVTGSIYLVGEARDHWFPSETILTELALRPTAQEARLESFSSL